MMKRNQSGFTLIEIAIVLVIIGLLLGGVLKGQELINSAKVKNIATDFKNIPVYIYGYQDKFRALPGDDLQVASHVGATACTPASTSCAQGNGVINGQWDDLTIASESFVFWQHVRLAGLAPGSTDTAQGKAYLPVNAAGGIIGIQSGSSTAPPVKDSNGNAIRGSYIICSDSILGKYAKQLDIQMDDGVTWTGSMIAVPQGSTYGFQATTTVLDDAASYTVCMGV